MAHIATESVIGMIDRQRQDQERMLKALATGSCGCRCFDPAPD